MIRFRLRELIADKAFREKRVITMGEVAEATGIHRTTLTKIANSPGYNCTTDNIDRLCQYFECATGDVIVFIPEEGDNEE